MHTRLRGTLKLEQYATTLIQVRGEFKADRLTRAGEEADRLVVRIARASDPSRPDQPDRFTLEAHFP